MLWFIVAFIANYYGHKNVLKHRWLPAYESTAQKTIVHKIIYLLSRRTNSTRTEGVERRHPHFRIKVRNAYWKETFYPFFATRGRHRFIIKSCEFHGTWKPCRLSTNCTRFMLADINRWKRYKGLVFLERSKSFEIQLWRDLLTKQALWCQSFEEDLVSFENVAISEIWIIYYEFHKKSLIFA